MKVWKIGYWQDVAGKGSVQYWMNQLTIEQLSRYRDLTQNIFLIYFLIFI